MLKHSNRIIAALLCAAMTLFFAGCFAKGSKLSLPAEVELKQGQIQQLMVEQNTQGLQLKWSSSNSQVAQVDEDGFVAALSPGTAEISVWDTGSALNASCKVTVIAAETAIQVPTNLTLALNGTSSQPLNPLIEGEDTTAQPFTYSSSDPSIATVDEQGTVSAVAVGS